MIEISVTLPDWFVWVLTGFCFLMAAVSFWEAWIKWKAYARLRERQRKEMADA